MNAGLMVGAVVLTNTSTGGLWTAVAVENPVSISWFYLLVAFSSDHKITVDINGNCNVAVQAQ